MNEYLYRNMQMYYPFLARDGVEFLEKEDGETMVIKLKSGRSVLYDDRDHSIRRLPKDSSNMTMEECKREFGYRLYRLMLRKGMTQADLSSATGIQQSLLSNYITGKTAPSFCNADKIAKVLECSMDDLRYID